VKPLRWPSSSAPACSSLSHEFSLTPPDQPPWALTKEIAPAAGVRRRGRPAGTCRRTIAPAKIQG
jgi:hypothetical protein